MDESVLRNLDTQHRQLSQTEAQLADLIAGGVPEASSDSAEAPGPGVDNYDALTARNDNLRAELLWAEIDLNAALGPEQHEQFERWRARQRLPWTASDFAVVGFAGVLGTAATLYDTTIETAVRRSLGQLKNTERFRRYEKSGRRLAIDHTGPGFGGPAHRVRSAGHDLARPFKALRQIRSGSFEGVQWTDRVREDVVRQVGRPVENLHEAVAASATPRRRRRHPAEPAFARMEPALRVALEKGPQVRP